jgi:hypothetical protein
MDMANSGRIRIKVTSGWCLGGEGNDAHPGDVLEAPGDIEVSEALKKIRTGYAIQIPEISGPGPAIHEDTPLPGSVTSGDPAIDSRDPVVEAPEAARRGRARTGGR